MFEQPEKSSGVSPRKIFMLILAGMFALAGLAVVGALLNPAGNPNNSPRATASPTPKASERPTKNGNNKEDVIVEPTEDYAYYAVKRYLEANLNDPDSLQDLEVVGMSKVKKMPGFYKVDVSYRAKNGFGALMLKRQGFVITHDSKGAAFDWIVVPVKD